MKTRQEAVRSGQGITSTTLKLTTVVMLSFWELFVHIVNEELSISYLAILMIYLERSDMRARRWASRVER